MCGIFGVVTKAGSGISFKQFDGIVKELFQLSEIRGKESSGVVVNSVNSDQIGLLKKSVPASRLIKDPAYDSLIRAHSSDAFNDQGCVHPVSLIAHTRLVTNGSQDDNSNNQPINKGVSVGVHNGIVCNIEQLWTEHADLDRQFEVDTELLIGMLDQSISENKSLGTALSDMYDKMEGTASMAVLRLDSDDLILSTNCGSLYYTFNKESGLFIFSSEKLIMMDLLNKSEMGNLFQVADIKWLRAGSALKFDSNAFDFNVFSYKEDQSVTINLKQEKKSLDNRSANRIVPFNVINSKSDSHYQSILQHDQERIDHLKRCTKCLLPKTFPFISYDHDGVCSYCHSYESLKFSGGDEFEKVLSQHRKPNGEPDCIVTLSGGRDSCYVLHTCVEEYGMNPIAYTYDWGMVTDLARRNQARMCGALGVEHIVISADITKKRRNIQKNVNAWLKRPRLGTIPLFMAGDKQYFYYANMLQKRYNTPLVLMGENMLETTNFKSGFCGIKPNFGTDHTFSLSSKDKAKMLWYYGKEYGLNPSYLNVSMADTMHAFFTYYFLKKSNVNVFDYLLWNEQDVENVLFNTYNWELSPDTTTSWRIGDGTAAFYNYIYFNVAGFSEFDTFRSNQIREGYITREEGLKLVKQENRPRYESLKWYLDTIGIDFEKAIAIINRIPKLYP